MTKAEILAAFEQLAERSTVTFDCGLLGKATSGIKLDVRVLTVAELDEATSAAEAYAIKRYGEAGVDGRKVDDAKQLEVIARAFLSDGAAAFPSADWLRERFSTDKLGVMLNAYNKAVRDSSLHPSDVSTDAVVALAKRCVEADDVDDMLLAVSRDFLAEAFVRLSRAVAEHLPSPVKA